MGSKAKPLCKKSSAAVYLVSTDGLLLGVRASQDGRGQHQDGEDGEDGQPQGLFQSHHDDNTLSLCTLLPRDSLRHTTPTGDW